MEKVESLTVESKRLTHPFLKSPWKLKREKECGTDFRPRQTLYVSFRLVKDGVSVKSGLSNVIGGMKMGRRNRCPNERCLLAPSKIITISLVH